VRERTWHQSQKADTTADGGVRLTLHVSIDAPLRSWILGFGALAKVEPPSLLSTGARFAMTVSSHPGSTGEVTLREELG
jgi:hypothetical protein